MSKALDKAAPDCIKLLASWPNPPKTKSSRCAARDCKNSKAEGRDPFAQTRFERTHQAAQIHANYPALDGAEVRVAGRIKTKRGQGKISFADLYDPSGKIQIVAQLDRLGEQKMNAWLELEMGDIVGVSGQVFQTKRGEVSVAATRFHVAGDGDSADARQISRPQRCRDALSPTLRRFDRQR